MNSGDAMSDTPWDGRHRYGRLDVLRTSVHDRFFADFPGLMSHDLLAAIAPLKIDLDAVASTTEAWEVYSGSVYWTLFLKGFLEYEGAGSLSTGNTYLSYLVRYYGPRGHDPGLEDVMSDPGMTVERVLWRFRDFALFREHAGARSLPEGLVSPVIVTIPDRGPADLRVYDVAFEAPADAALIDGWHRLFAAKVWGVSTLEAEYLYVTST